MIYNVFGGTLNLAQSQYSFAFFFYLTWTRINLASFVEIWEVWSSDCVQTPSLPNSGKTS